MLVALAIQIGILIQSQQVLARQLIPSCKDNDYQECSSPPCSDWDAAKTGCVGGYYKLLDGDSTYSKFSPQVSVTCTDNNQYCIASCGGYTGYCHLPEQYLQVEVRSGYESAFRAECPTVSPTSSPTTTSPTVPPTTVHPTTAPTTNSPTIPPTTALANNSLTIHTTPDIGTSYNLTLDNATHHFPNDFLTSNFLSSYYTSDHPRSNHNPAYCLPKYKPSLNNRSNNQPEHRLPNHIPGNSQPNT
ncbi:hypothetical protein CYMTET_37282 [Cymbomonas tetramitiformis]|uniref:Uncharacterized protein n=1 Tax=Cymbomonas tetramitiformis TaxID=36881 RepID=A0AAE0F6D5_9CHLO|nr:hypothetical protein CYMTET_37282 [Cymbomonas tetramitiformis]